MLNKRKTYGDDWGVPSAEHPAGPCLNRSAPDVEDGSYFEKSWVNDLMALPGAIMNAAGYTPNGTEDTATASQVFDALVNGRWSSIANYTNGTIVSASDGKQYYCKQSNGRDTQVVDPSTVSDRDFWVEWPYQLKENANGTAKIFHDDTVEQSGPVGVIQPGSNSVINYVQPMNTLSYLSAQFAAVRDGATPLTLVVDPSPFISSFTVRNRSNAANGSSFWMARGKL
ncbi:hypothetical protein NVP1016O_51 [Vibrio phage 1.016.O._10N.286.46.A11]|nr:hypothetical protein NVP1016O_51 [Vibrio phage 1.016.O._10N.286.46.A11]AUR85281.1 hypothetical protein NVP1071A_51 [Vibrio phage 1.071.A._10N.286.46.A12]